MITLSCTCGAAESVQIDYAARPAVRRTQVLQLVESKDPKTGATLITPTPHSVDVKAESNEHARARAEALESAEYAGRIAAFEAAHTGDGHDPSWIAGEPTGGTPEPAEDSAGTDGPEEG